jgi:NAD(P)H-dependent FMN reductase
VASALSNTYDQGHGFSLHLVQSRVSKEDMLKIALIIGSTRPGRKSETVAKWAYDIDRQRDDAEFELLDLADINPPLLDEPLAAMSGQYSPPHTRAWSVRVASFDGYVFVTPEYNHGVSSALKNAIDFLYREWADKAAGFIRYGYTMGARAIEHLRLVMAAVQVAAVRPQVGLSLFTDFENSTLFKPAPIQGTNLNTKLDQLIAWSGALQAPGKKRGRLTMNRDLGVWYFVEVPKLGANVGVSEADEQAVKARENA